MSKTKLNRTRVFLILIFVINILLRVPSLFDPVSYGDECIYLTLGRAFNQGLVFYRDIHDNKPPLLYLIAALGGSKLFWLRLITILWNTVNVWLIYKVAKILLKKEKAGLVAAALFAFFSLLPEGRVANGEIFMIMPATLGVLSALTGYWLLSGLAFSLAFLFKVPITFDFLGLILALFIFKQPKKSFTKKKIKATFLSLIKDKKLYLILLGFLLPIALSIIYYSLVGAFTPYVRSALLQNIGYLSSWSGANIGLYQRGIILLIVSALIFYWRQDLGFAFSLLSLMTVFGLYGVFLAERPYPHYLMEIVPWGTLLLTVLFFQKKRPQIFVTLLLIVLIFIGVQKYKFWWYPHLPYYQNFWRFTRGKINKEEFFASFGHKVLNDYEVAKYLKTHTLPEERVFIWGDGSCIYPLAERLPPGRYTANYHIYDFSGYGETLGAIEAKSPPFIVVLESAEKRFPQLEALLMVDYLKTLQIGEAEIYQKLIP